jgi:hypothetical protein
MNELVQKMAEIEKHLASQNGSFKLFALFLRDGSPDKWDVLVSADWINADKRQALKIIVQQLTTKLNKDELISLSRVVVIDKDNQGLSEINTEIHDENILGLDIKYGFLISSQGIK